MTKIIKYAIVLAILTLVAGWVVKYGSDRYDQGYNTARAEHRELIGVQVEALKQERLERREVEVELQDILNEPRPVEVRIHEVEKQVEHCDLSGIIRLWNIYAEKSRRIQRAVDK